MTHDPEGLSFRYDAPEADVIEQRIPVDVGDDDGVLDAVHITVARDWDASEARLIDQAIAVPVPDDDPDLAH
jgi:hypothetical protein